MNNAGTTKHEPLFHIVKRSSMVWWKSWLIRIGSVAAALIVCAVITVLLTGKNPLGVYATMIDGSFGTPRRIWGLFQNIAILLCISLAVTPAFKMRFWNTGAEGQVLVGGLATASCMILLGDKLQGRAVQLLAAQLHILGNVLLDGAAALTGGSEAVDTGHILLALALG